MLTIISQGGGVPRVDGRNVCPHHCHEICQRDQHLYRNTCPSTPDLEQY